MSGILGVFSFEDYVIFPKIYYGLYALQHRGQEGVGIGTIDQGQVNVHQNKGLISENFGTGLVDTMPGNKGIGFVEYNIHGENRAKMPVARDNSLLGIDGVIDNPNFSIDECMDYLNGDLIELQRYFETITGKFTLVFMSDERLIVMKNQDGIKPLAIGRLGNTMIASSETCAIETIGGRIIREIQPGEMFVQTKDQSTSYYLTNSIEATENLDAFEFIYTARPDSILDGVSVYDARYRLGQALWQEQPLDNAIVIGAPDSGIIASLGYANASGLPYQEGFVRNRYVGRTFIKATQLDREQGLQVKLTPIRQNVANRNIILVDDSIVRGTTIKRTVESLKEMGANSVHVRIASPAILNSIGDTLDITDIKDLIAANHSLDEMREQICCDSLHFLSLDGFHRAIGRNQLYDYYFKRADHKEDSSWV